MYRSVPSTFNTIKSSPYIEPCIPRTFFFSLRSRISPSKPIHPHGNQSQTSRCWIHFSVENNEKWKKYPRGRIKLLSFFLVDTFHFPRLLAWWGACKEEVSHQSSPVASRSNYYCVCYQFFFAFHLVTWLKLLTKSRDNPNSLTWEFARSGLSLSQFNNNRPWSLQPIPYLATINLSLVNSWIHSPYVVLGWSYSTSWRFLREGRRCHHATRLRMQVR